LFVEEIAAAKTKEEEEKVEGGIAVVAWRTILGILKESTLKRKIIALIIFILVFCFNLILMSSINVVVI
jgi:hypothetical protein